MAPMTTAVRSGRALAATRRARRSTGATGSASSHWTGASSSQRSVSAMVASASPSSRLQTTPFSVFDSTRVITATPSPHGLLSASGDVASRRR